MSEVAAPKATNTLAQEAIQLHLDNVRLARLLPASYLYVAPEEVLELIHLATVYQVDWTLGLLPRKKLRPGETAIMVRRYTVWRRDAAGQLEEEEVLWEIHRDEHMMDSSGDNMVPVMRVEHAKQLSAVICREGQRRMDELVRTP